MRSLDLNPRPRAGATFGLTLTPFLSLALLLPPVPGPWTGAGDRFRVPGAASASGVRTRCGTGLDCFQGQARGQQQGQTQRRPRRRPAGQRSADPATVTGFPGRPSRGRRRCGKRRRRWSRWGWSSRFHCSGTGLRWSLHLRRAGETDHRGTENTEGHRGDCRRRTAGQTPSARRSEREPSREHALVGRLVPTGGTLRVRPAWCGVREGGCPQGPV